MLPLDNPAGRLHELLMRARGRPAAGNAQKEWAAVFGLQLPGQLPILWGHAADIVELARETRARIELLDDQDPAALLEHFGQIEETLNNFSAMAAITMGKFLHGVNDTSMYGLRLCSSTLHRLDPDAILGKDTIEDLLGQIRPLIDKVRLAPDLDEKQRRWILSRLQDIELALVETSVGGYPKLAQVTDSLVGGIQRAGFLERLRGSAVVRDIVAFVVALDLSLNVAANFTAITSPPNTPNPQPTISVSVSTIQRTCGLDLRTPRALEAGIPDTSQHVAVSKEQDSASVADKP